MRHSRKMLWHGFRIVQLPDDFVREAIRVWHGNRLTAVIQKNGNIGVNGTGIFESPNNVHCMLRVAKCLHGLKLVAPEFVQAFAERVAQSGRKTDLARIKDEADELGYKLVEK